MFEYIFFECMIFLSKSVHLSFIQNFFIISSAFCCFSHEKNEKNTLKDNYRIPLAEPKRKTLELHFLAERFSCPVASIIQPNQHSALVYNFCLRRRSELSSIRDFSSSICVHFSSGSNAFEFFFFFLKNGGQACTYKNKIPKST